MNKKEYIKAQISIGVLCMALAFGITVQCRSVKSNEDNIMLTREQANNVLREENLSLKEKNADLTLQLNAAQNDMEEYRKAAESSGNYESVLTNQLRRAELLAGLSDVTGQGVRIVLDDSEKKSTDDSDVAEFIIHDSDLRLVITELAAAGGEAFCINGQRIVSVTPIRCVGPVITINQIKTAPPFEILAIGDKKTLEAAVNMRGGISDLLSAYGIKVSVSAADDIKIPRYDGAFNPIYSENYTKEGENR